MKSALSSKPSYPRTIAKQSHSEFTTPPDLYLRDSRNLAFYNGTSRRIFTRFPMRSIIFLGGLVLLFLSAMVSQIIADGIQRSEMDTLGVTAQAVVTDSRKEEGMDIEGLSITSYYVRYSFTVPKAETGQIVEYSFERNVLFAAYSKGSKVFLTYLPSDPTIIRLDGEGFPANSKIHILIGMFAAVLFVTVIIVLSRRYWRNHHLFVRGRLLHGNIVLVAKSEDTDSEGYTTYSYGMWLRYRFQTPVGDIMQPTFKKEIIQEALYSPNTPPKIGTPVAVLYVSNNLYELL